MPNGETPQDSIGNHWLLFPSLWECCPTALLHLLLVELRCVPIACLSWYAVVVAQALMDPEASTHQKNMIYKGSSVSVFDLGVWFSTSLVLIPAVILIVHEIAEFIRHGAPRSCGSGAYLMFTWRNQKERTYLILCTLMCAFPAIDLLVVSIDILLASRGKLDLEDKGYGSSDEEILARTVVAPIFLLIVSLASLLFPIMPVNGWDESLVGKIVFKRSLTAFFQANDIYGLRLVDALWKAKYEKTDAMLDYVHHPDDIDIALDICHEAKEC